MSRHERRAKEKQQMTAAKAVTKLYVEIVGTAELLWPGRKAEVRAYQKSATIKAIALLLEPNIQPAEVPEGHEAKVNVAEIEVPAGGDLLNTTKGLLHRVQRMRRQHMQPETTA